MIEIQIYDVSAWRTYERGLPNDPQWYERAIREASRFYPGRRIRAVDQQGRIVDII
jgi:hypothetical protein